MRSIVIGDQHLEVKDYHCAEESDYLDKPDGKLWLYVNLTDICNGKCPFCINQSVARGKDKVDPSLYRETLLHVEKDIVTNGTGFANILDTLNIEHLDSVHLSRHMITDRENDAVFGFQTATSEEIASVLTKMDDPAQVVLNCVLMAGGIDTLQRISHYLEHAFWLGVCNVSFI